MAEYFLVIIGGSVVSYYGMLLMLFLLRAIYNGSKTAMKEGMYEYILGIRRR